MGSATMKPGDNGGPPRVEFTAGGPITIGRQSSSNGDMVVVQATEITPVQVGFGLATVDWQSGYSVETTISGGGVLSSTVKQTVTNHVAIDYSQDHLKKAAGMTLALAAVTVVALSPELWPLLIPASQRLNPLGVPAR